MAQQPLLVAVVGKQGFWQTVKCKLVGFGAIEVFMRREGQGS